MKLTLGSLFDGSGTFPLAALRYEITPVWASEIEPMPIRVTRKNLPRMLHLGDIHHLAGDGIPPVDIITGGSPCFPAGTPILTSRGYKPIENIRVGDLVYTHRHRWRKILDAGSRVSPTIIVASGAHEITTTANHPFYAHPGKWTPARDMLGKHWALPVRVFPPAGNRQALFWREWCQYQATRADSRRIPISVLTSSENIRREFLQHVNSLTILNQANRVLAAGLRTLAVSLETSVSEGFAWRKVDRVYPTGENETVYNLAVEQDQSYVADSVVVHNCQNLSMAGNRRGLSGAKSSLFFEQIRVIREMREATNGRYPAYAVWENVPGAFGTNQGRDFQEVLHEFAQTASGNKPVSIPGPAGGVWEPAGAVLGDGWSLAWRVLDAQYWGVPQRRKRIFLVTDFTGHDAGKILFDPQGGQRDPGKSGEERQDTTRDSAGRVGASSGIGPAGAGSARGDWFNCDPMEGDYTGPAVVSQTLRHSDSRTTRPKVCVPASCWCISAEDSYAMQSANPEAGIYGTDTARTLTAGYQNPNTRQGGTMIVEHHTPPRVRQITPLECSRLQGFPDWWAGGLTVEEPSLAEVAYWLDVWQGWGEASGETRAYSEAWIRAWLRREPSDSSLYKMWGNGIALPCAERVIGGIAAAAG